MVQANIPAVLTRLRKRLGLVTEVPGLHLNPIIYLTVDTAVFLATNKVVAQAINGTVSDTRALLTVPVKKRWLLHGFSVSRNTGDRTINQICILDGAQWQLAFFTATDTYRSGVLGHPIPLGENAELQTYFTSAGTTDGTWNVAALIEEEDAY